MARLNKALWILFVSTMVICESNANVIPKDTFRLANEAFSKGAMDDAIQLYQSIADGGFKSLPLYHNLGTAYANKENWAAARLYLERAQLEDPLNAEVINNLEQVKEKVDDPYHYPKYPLFNSIEYIHSRFSTNAFAWMLLVISLLFIASLYQRFVVASSNAKTWLWISAVFLIIFSTLVFFEQTYVRFHNRMLVLFEASELYRAPDEYGEVVTELMPGHKLRIQEELGPWVQVDLADGTEGWIQTSKVRAIKKG